MSRQGLHGWVLSHGRRAAAKRQRTRRGIGYSRRLRIEPLEDRRLLSITVNTLADELDGSVVDGDVSLRDALLAATPFETIDFAPSLFYSGPTTLTLKLGELRITKDVTISGPGSGLLTIDASGNDLTPALDNGDGSRVFNVNNGSPLINLEAKINGMTLTGGDSAGDGGAIRNFENLATTDLVATGNSSRHNGGGIFSSGSLTLISSTVSGNWATGSGGGVYSSGPYLTVQSSTISNNHGVTGGGVVTRASASYWSFTDSTISGNSATGRGGGLYGLMGTGRITNSKIQNNAAGAQGGGVYAGQSTLVAIDSTISGNSARGAGGGVYVLHGGLTLNTSTVSGNSTGDDGGGIFSRGSNLSILSSTISGNSATDDAGGLRIGTDAGQTATIAHSTITANRADLDGNGAGFGGGIVADVGTSVGLNHTIVATNTQPVNLGPDIFGKVVATYSFIGTNIGASIVNNGGNLIGTAAAPLDPMLGPLADNGGPTLTQLPLFGSPVVDAGDPAAVAGVTVPQFDQRGNPYPRVFDGGGSLDARIDIGATELLPGKIEGQKWNDLNGNGFKDFGEPGLAGWTIYLDLNENGALDAGEPSTMTDANGNYSFGQLVAGTYTVSEVQQSKWQQTYPGAALGGIVSVFDDPTFAGIGDPYNEEANLTSFGLTVHTFSGTSGSQWIAGLAGSHLLVIPEQEVGSLASALSPAAVTALQNFVAGGGGVVINGSNGNGNTAALLNSIFGFSVAEGYPYNSSYLTAAAAGTEFVNGYYYLPSNYSASALFTSTLPAGSLSIYDYGGESVVSLMHYGSGKIVFLGWDWYSAYPNGYQDGGWIQTLNEAVLEIGANKVPGSHVITVQQGNDITGVDFGNQALPGSISGQKWNDVNANGVKEAGEPGLAGWTIYVDTNSDGYFDFGDLSTTTDADGNYVITGVQPGTYTVGEVSQFGWDQTFPGPGVTRTVTVHSDEETTGIDFGNHAAPGSIQGQKWNDLNGDGVREFGEPGLPGWTIYLDSNQDGVFEVGEPSTTTDASGNYTFLNVTPGTYSVQEVLQPTWRQTYPGPFSPWLITVGPGGTVTGVDFGNQVIPATIEGQKWNDLNGNGVKDPGEPGLVGWQIYLDTNSNGSFDSINGHIEPDDFPAGTTLNTVKPGVTLSIPGIVGTNIGAYSSISSTGSLVFSTSGSSGEWYTSRRLRVDFASPTDFVSIDAVSDDSYDLGTLEAYDASGNLVATYITSPLTYYGQYETMTVSRPQHDIAYVLASGYGGEAINLDNLNFGSSEPSTTTDGNGKYAFTNLAPGTYHVGEVMQANWQQTFPGPPGINTVTVQGGDDITGVNFGNHALPGTIKGQKWSDVNGNGVKDTGEPGLANWTLYLDANGNGAFDGGEPSTTTDSLGNYTFTNLSPGLYTVREVAKAGWQQTYPTSVVGGSVAVFDDGSFVDSAGGTSSESDTEQATLASLGFTVSTFVGTSGAQWTTGLSGSRTLVIPEQEIASLSPAMSSAAVTALQNFVSGGGGLVINGSYGSSANTQRLLNSIFGFSVTEQESVASFSQTAATAGTAFSSGAAFLPANNGTNALVTSTLPAGALSLYETSGQTAVALMHYGSGKIVFLGWDWYNAAPTGSLDGGWVQALNEAVHEVGGNKVPGAQVVTIHPADVITGVDFGNQSLVGDYNHNGIVDAADYTVWRDALGSHVTAYTGADGSGNGVVDAADLNLWTTHFGQTLAAGAGSGAGAAATVSESVEQPTFGTVATSPGSDLNRPPVSQGGDVPVAGAVSNVSIASRPEQAGASVVVALPAVSAAKAGIVSARAIPPASSSLQDDALLLWLSSRVDGASRSAAGDDLTTRTTNDGAGAGAATDSYCQLVDDVFERLAVGV